LNSANSFSVDCSLGIPTGLLVGILMRGSAAGFCRCTGAGFGLAERRPSTLDCASW